MVNRRILLATLALPAALLLTDCATTDPGTMSRAEHDPFYPTRVPAKIDFVRDVKPILESQCLECHNSKDSLRHAGLNFETYQLAVTSGRQPPVIRPGDPEGSLLIQAMENPTTHPVNMPPSPDKLWGTRLKILKKWIRQGADWPEDVRLVRPQDWQI